MLKEVAISFLSGFAVRVGSLFCVFKISKRNFFSINSNSGMIKIAMLMKGNAFVSRFVAPHTFSIGTILSMADVSKITNTVIGTNAVNMVNDFIRPLSMNVKPSQSVGKILSIVYADMLVSLAVGSSSNSSGAFAIPRLYNSGITFFGSQVKRPLWGL